MRTFLSLEQPARFWNISLDGCSVTVCRGVRGSAGETKARTYASPRTAKKACARLVREALADGLVEVVTQPGPPLRQALEEAVLLHPEDIAAHRAHADYLMEQGDPRGELISVQLALEDEGVPARERGRLQKREKELLDAHARQWLGGLAPALLDGEYPGLSGSELSYQESSFRFVRGWLDTVEVRHLTVQFARALAQAPETRLLRRLLLRAGAAWQMPGSAPENEDTGYFEPGPDILRGKLEARPALFALSRSPYLGNVRTLEIGEPVGDDEVGSCHTDGAGTADLVAVLPRLEELRLFCYGVDPGALFALRTLRHLRVLQLYHQSYYPLEILAANPSLGRLTHLLLHPHAGDANSDEAYINLEHVRAVVRSRHLKSLTHLRLRLTDAGDDGCQEVVDSGVLKRLRVLDLRHGRITDAGGQILARCPDLKNLELLDVTRNGLTAKGVAALRATGVTIKADDQHTREEIEEGFYLYFGDCE